MQRAAANNDAVRLQHVRDVLLARSLLGHAFFRRRPQRTTRNDVIVELRVEVYEVVIHQGEANPYAYVLVEDEVAALRKASSFVRG